MELSIAILLTILSAYLVFSSIVRRSPGLFIFSLFALFGHMIPLLDVSGIPILEYDIRRAVFALYPHELIIIITVFTLFFSLGYFALFHSDGILKSKVVSKAANGGGINLWIANWAVLVCIALLIFYHPFGWEEFIRNNFLRTPVPNEFSTFIYILSVSYAFLTTYQLAFDLKNKSITYFQPITCLVLFFLLGGRIQFIITAATYLVLLSRYDRISLKSLAAILIVCMAPVTYIIQTRLTLQRNIVSFWDMFGNQLNDLSMLDSYRLALQFAHEFGHQPLIYFQQALQIVPRSLIGDKELQLSVLFRQTFYGDDLGGHPPGMVGEFYLIGGVAACAVGGLAFGWLLRRLDEGFARLPEMSIARQALVASFLPFMAFYFVRVGLDSTVFRGVLLILTFLAVTAASAVVGAPRRSSDYLARKT